MPEENNNVQTLQNVKDSLIHLGGDEQLLIYLTGAGGIDKCRVIFTNHSCCKEFSASLQVALDENYFMITACTGFAAVLLDGMQIHKSAHLNCKRIADEFREEWENNRGVFIDECYFFSIVDLENLDKK